MESYERKEKLRKIVNEISSNTGINNDIDIYCISLGLSCKTYFETFLSADEPLVGSIFLYEDNQFVFFLRNCIGVVMEEVASSRESIFVAKVTTVIKYRLSLG